MTGGSDAIARSSALGPPSREEAEIVVLLLALSRRRPKLIQRVVEIARDRELAHTIRRLHDAADLPGWARPFEEARIRYESVAAVLASELSTGKKQR